MMGGLQSLGHARVALCRDTWRNVEADEQLRNAQSLLLGS